MDVVTVKILTTLGLFLVCLTAGLVPSLVGSWSRRHIMSHTASYIICMLSCAAGGVFLGTLLLHLLPEIRYLAQPILLQLHTDYPLPEFCVAIGFFAIFLIEEIVLLCLGKDKHGHDLLEVMEGERRHLKEHHHHQHDHHQLTPSLTSTRSESETSLSEPELSIDITPPQPRAASHSGSRGRYGAVMSGADRRRVWSECDAERTCLLQEEGSSPCPEMVLPRASDTTTITKLLSLILLVSLSFHSIFEGIAVGVESDRSAVISLFVGLAAHKLAISASLGVQLWQSFSSPGRVSLHVLVFSLMTPLGALVGVWVSGGGAHSLPALLMQGAAAGTFLYITFFEIIEREMENEKPGLLKLLCIVLGFSLIAVLHLLPFYNHQHDGVPDTPAAASHDHTSS